MRFCCAATTRPHQPPPTTSIPHVSGSSPLITPSSPFRTRSSTSKLLIARQASCPCIWLYKSGLWARTLCLGIESRIRRQARYILQCCNFMVKAFNIGKCFHYVKLQRSMLRALITESMVALSNSKRAVAMHFCPNLNILQPVT